MNVGDAATHAIDLTALGAWVVSEGHSHLDWDRVDEAIKALPADAPVRQMYWGIVEQWLTRLASELGPDYCVFRSTHSLLLTSSSDEQAMRWSRFVDRTLGLISSTLGDMALKHADWPVVVMFFGTQAKYYTYVSHFYDDGEHAASGGMCLRSGYAHVVLPVTGFGEAETIAHELTHLLLTGRDLPLWLEEGVCQVMEEIATGNRHFTFDREMSRRQREHWRVHGIQSFWSGEAFSKPDDHQELSYRLAQAIVRVMIGDHRKSFLQFIRDARWPDAGDSAAREHFGCDAAAFISPMLGDGDWAPKPFDGASQNEAT
jgi:hypothetical protein